MTDANAFRQYDTGAITVVDWRSPGVADMKTNGDSAKSCRLCLQEFSWLYLLVRKFGRRSEYHFTRHTRVAWKAKFVVTF